MTIATEYASYVSDLQYEDIPEDVINYSKKLTLDALGISIGARSRVASSDAIAHAVDELATGGEATVFATGERLEPEYAALLNGALIHSLDYDDTHREASLHPGTTVIPSAIAVAETADREVTGKELLTAIVAGYEINCRLGMAVNPESHYERGFHGTATIGTFGATAAAGKILGLDQNELINAFGLNGSQAAGSQQYLANGSWNKRAHPGLAAHSAVLAVTFASSGFYGSEAPIEGNHGFLNAYSDDPSPHLAIDGLGERYELTKTALKPYPCCRYMHAPLDGVLDIVEDASLRPEDVDRVEVEMAETGINLIGRPIERKRDPKSFFDAQFSIYFGVALAITEGDISLDKFIELGESGYGDEFERIMEVTELQSTERMNDIFPEKWSAYITIEAGDEKFESHAEYAKGEPENPMTWDDVVEKYEELTKHLDPDARNAFLRKVRSLETANVDDLQEALRGAQSNSIPEQ